MNYFAHRIMFDETQRRFFALHSIARKDNLQSNSPVFVLYSYNRGIFSNARQIFYRYREKADRAFEEAINGSALDWRGASGWLWAASGGSVPSCFKPETRVEVKIPESLWSLSRRNNPRRRKFELRQDLFKATKSLNIVLARKGDHDYVEFLADEITLYILELKFVTNSTRRHY